MPRAYIETILSSKPGNRRWYLAICCGSKVDRRSRGTSRSILPVSVTTVLRPYPLRLLPSSSPPRWWSISAFNARSASAFFRPSRRPFGSKAVLGSAPASSWSRIASGIRGSLRRGMSGLLRSHHARPYTKFPPGPPDTDEVVWFICGTVDAELLGAVLAAFAEEVGAGEGKLVILVLDNAGCHVSGDLVVPKGIELMLLPPYTPELRPAEHLWPLADEAVANKHFATLKDLDAALSERCRTLADMPEVIKAATHFGWWPAVTPTSPPAH